MASRRLALLLAVAGLAGACQRHESAAKPALTGPQEEAVKQYAALLEKQIEKVEESADVLATVQQDAASKENAKVRLVELALASQVLQKKESTERPADREVLAAAGARVAGRKDKATQRYLEQISRINKMPGGEDFFQKELRPLLESLQGR